MHAAGARVEASLTEVLERLEAAVDALIEAAIDEVYLTRQRARLVELTVEVQRRCVAGGLAPEGILACDRVARTRSGCQRSDSRSGI